MEKKQGGKLNVRRVIVVVVLLIILILAIIGIISLFKKIFAKEVVAGNQANMGLAIEDGSEVYYNKYETGIVKVKGGKEYQITDETAYSMQIVGNTIYYLTVSPTNTIDLKSVKTNGDGLTLIKVLKTSISKFYIEKGYAYYATDFGGIAKLNLENSEEKQIVTANIRDFVLVDDVIYFTDIMGYLYSVQTDGNNKIELAKDYNIKNIQVLKKWIYFYDEKENALCKIKKDGSKKQTVATFVNNEVYNVTSKKIYYLDTVNKQICRCDLKGKKSKPIVTLKALRTKINIVKGIVYYLDDSKNSSQIYQMYRVKQNGGATNPIDY